jgi:integrase
MDDKNLLRAWQRVLNKAGVRYRNFHTIRHTYATKLFENGVPLKTVSMLLGHADIKITADTYTHVMPREKEKAAETLNQLLM